MKAFIRNFAGIGRADLLELDQGITLVCGLNGAGKSSVLQACAAAVCANPLTRGLRFKNQATRLVHAGADRAQVRVEGDRGEVTIRWPDCSVEAEGKPPHGDPIAVGLRRYADMEGKQRGAYLTDVLDAEPTQADLARALKKSDIVDQNLVANVWAKIQEQGWDACYQAIKGRGAKLKGRWEGVAGVNYGKQKARDWTPPGWAEDLASASKEQLDADVVAAQSAVEARVGQVAVSEDRLAELRMTSEAGRAAARRDEELTSQIETLASEVEQRGKERAELPGIGQDNIARCPHCNELVKVVRFDLLERSDAPALTADEIKDRRMAIAAADGALSNAQGRLQTAQGEQVRARDEMARGTAADQEIASVSNENADEEALNQARRGSERAKSRKVAFEKHVEATRIQVAIQTNQAIVSALAPDGVRQTVISTKLADFNSMLADLSEQYSSERVTIDQNLELCLADRPYPMLSRSEQHRADSVLQLGLAMRTSAPLVVIDEADILDPPSRPGLLRMLRWANVPALVGMMASPSQKIPDLSANGLGRTLWITDGQVSEVAANV